MHPINTDKSNAVKMLRKFSVAGGDHIVDSYNKPSFGKKGSEGNIYNNNYNDTTTQFIGIRSLLLRWKGSVYRLIWWDLLLFIIAFGFFAILYRAVLIHYPVHKQHFELLCIYANRYSSAVPITFLTGFYVSSVVSRWWDQFMSLSYPDQLALKLVAYVPGNVRIDYYIK